MIATFSNFKLIVITLFIAFPFLEIKSQDDCNLILEKAEALFDQGVIEDIPELLSECIIKGFSSEQNIRAKKLIILAYLFDNNTQEAENSMISFLKDYPEYQIQSSDPAEFTRLFASFKTFPFISVGAFIGGNISSAILKEQYGTYNLNSGEGDFAIASPEFQIGAGANFFLTDRLELNVSGIYARNTFLYSNLQYDFAEIFTKETHQRLEFPVTATFDLTENKWQPYVSMGISYGIIINASSHYKRSYVNTGSSTLKPREMRYVDISDRRNSSSINGVFGGGVKNKVPGGYLFFDLKYFYGLSQLVNPDNRWDQETAFTFYHADGDFHLNYFTFSIGYRYSFYKSIKL